MLWAGWWLRSLGVCPVDRLLATGWQVVSALDGADALAGERWDGVGWRSPSGLRRDHVVTHLSPSSPPAAGPTRDGGFPP